MRGGNKMKLEDILKMDKAGIHCMTELEVHKLFRKLDELDYKWNGGNRLTEHTWWTGNDSIRYYYIYDDKTVAWGTGSKGENIIEFDDIEDFQPIVDTNTPEELETTVKDKPNMWKIDANTAKLINDLHMIMEEQRREIDFVKGQNKRLTNRLMGNI